MDKSFDQAVAGIHRRELGRKLRAFVYAPIMWLLATVGLWAMIIGAIDLLRGLFG